MIIMRQQQKRLGNRKNIIKEKYENKFLHKNEAKPQAYVDGAIPT